MKYIEKDIIRVPASYQKELTDAKLDPLSLSSGAHSSVKNKHSLFDNEIKHLSSYSDLLKVIYDEQGGICCYCGCALSEDHRRNVLEHLDPISVDYTRMGDYENMMISCNGNCGEKREKKGKKYIHCDAFRGNSFLPITPLNSVCEDLFKYEFDGTVAWVNADAKITIDNLNLNCKSLCLKRETAIYNSVLNEDGDFLSNDELKLIQAHYRQLHNGRYAPFCIAVIRFIDKILGTE